MAAQHLYIRLSTPTWFIPQWFFGKKNNKGEFLGLVYPDTFWGDSSEPGGKNIRAVNVIYWVRKNVFLPFCVSVIAFADHV